MDEYNLCIIGAGMIGSCAAHHASKLLPPNTKLCLIGPQEPKDDCPDPCRSIYGSYYDESRLILSSDLDLVWSIMAQRSLHRYRDVEKESGTSFYNEVGSLLILDDEKDIAQTLASAKIAKKRIQVEPWDELRKAESLKNFNFDGKCKCIYGYKGGGYINPRSLVTAYQKTAQNRGCTIIRDIVCRVSRTEGGKRWKLVTDNGRTINTSKILIATGAFTSYRNLLPSGMKAKVSIKGQSCLFAQVDAADLHRFRNMPVIGKNTKENICWIVPPIKYPNGKYYIKLGSGGQFETDIRTEDAMREWYQETAPEGHKQGLWNILRTIVPDFKPISLHTSTCATTETPSGRPYIDLLHPTLGVAVGGNRHAANSCDEIGRLAIELLIKGQWNDTELKQTLFMFVPSPKL